MPSTSEMPLWFKRRGYLHFDHPISVDKAKSIVMNKDAVSRHAFFPFICYEIPTSKLKFDPVTNKFITTQKPRDVAYSSHIDSHIYAYYAEILSTHYEQALRNKGLQDSVLAFRKIDKKNNINFAKNAFDYIKNKSECSAIALDFSKFFTTLDHKILKREWADILGSNPLPNDHYNVFKSLTNHAHVKRDKLFEIFQISPYNQKLSGKSKCRYKCKCNCKCKVRCKGKCENKNNCNNPLINRRTRICDPLDFRNKVRKEIKPNIENNGIPQGSPISALLSNIYMISFDEKMKRYANNLNGEYFRYCDDMLFIVPSQEKEKILARAKSEIEKLKVTINEKKTEIRDFKYDSGKLCSFGDNKKKPLQYLGFLFDGTSTFLRSSSLSRYSKKMKGGVKLAKNTMDKENAIRKSKGEPLQTQIYKRKLHKLYSYRGQRNFISYGYRAAKIMDSSSIRKQLRPLLKRLEDRIKLLESCSQNK